MMTNPSTPPESSPSTTPEATPPRSLWSLVLLLGVAVVIGVILSLVVSFIQVLQMVDTRAIFLGLDGLRLPILTGLLTIVAALAAIVWRRPRFSFVCVSLGMLVVLGFGFYSLFRIESFYGNMVPRFTWRWTPETEEPFSDYHHTQPVAVVKSHAEDVLQATEFDFPGFLGAQRDGIVRGVTLEADWENHVPELLWRQPIGIGWAGFTIVGNLAITQEQRGELETVVAYDVVTGQEVWVHADPVRFEDEHGDGPRGVPTFHEGRIYTIGAEGLLNCLNGADGRLIWQQQVLDDPEKNNLLWGMCGSPLIVDDWVVVTPGGGEGQAIKAFNADDGEPIWSKGDDRTAYASPSFVTLAGQPQFLCFNGAGLRGFSSEGDPLWLFPWITQGEHQRVNVAQPIVVTPPGMDEGAGYVLMSSGYSMGMALVRVAPDDQGEWSAEPVWLSKALKSKMSNFVVLDGYIYGFDNGIFTCLRLADGRRMWKRGRYGHGQVLASGDLLIVQAESGDVVLLKATPDGHTTLATLPALDDKTWNHAALAGDLLVVRNDRQAACYRLPTK